MEQILENLKKEDPAFAFLRSYEGFLSKEPLLSKSEIAKSFYNLGKVHYDKSDLIQAEDNFIKALNCASRPHDSSFILKTLGFLIRISSERLEDFKAQKYIKLSEEVVDGLSKTLPSLNSEYFYNVGVVNTYKGDFVQAKNNFLFSYKKSKEENEPELLAKSLLAMATNSYYNKEFDEALEYIRQLDELLKIINKSYLMGSMYLCAGRVYVELGLYEQALTSFRRANAILQEKKCWNLYGYILLGRGVIYKRMGEYNNALLFFHLAMDSTDPEVFRRLSNLIKNEIEEVNDSSVDLYLDRTNRRIREKYLGVIDFKHRFILLEILFLLAKNIGQYFDKEKLAKAIWKDEYNPLIHDKLIYTSVSRLRKLIEPEAHGKADRRKYIIRGKDGYTFNPNVKIRFHLENRAIFEKAIANVEISLPV